jgi:hypothetical protein
MAVIPSTPSFKTIRVRKRFAVAIAKSPISYAQQAHKRSGEEWIIEAELPPLTESQATAWITWLLAQEGSYNTFSLDVSEWDASASGDTSITFRLADNDTGWTIGEAMTFGIKFNAYQAQ